MKPRIGPAARTFGVLVVAQATCLGLGLWLEARFAEAVAAHALAPATDGSPQADRRLNA